VNLTRLLACVPALAAALLLASCGGGGSSGDVRPGEAIAVAPTSGPDSFLLFPNPQVQADGSLQTDSPAYAEAYYDAIDPNNAKDTLVKWKAANGFDTGTGTQVTVVFGDRRDLGYGRRMTARQNADGTLAFLVENYLINGGAGYVYSPLNIEAAIVRDPKSLLLVNAIEFSPGPAGGASFAKFFNFSTVTGRRENAVDLDGRGDKAMPSACITCHGGRGDALTPPDASGKRRFNLLQDAVSQTRGDVAGRLHPFEADAFDFSTTPGFTRGEQEAPIKAINRMILCSYPLPSPSDFPEDACRRPASQSEWQGSAAALIKASYGGDGLPSPTFSDTDVPPSWRAAGQSTLYRSVIVPACRGCHLVRGTGAQSDIDFATFEKFRAYAERTRAHVMDRGNMPLAKIVFDAFWGSSQPETLATFLQDQGLVARDSTGAVLRPGRPVADPGPDRVIRQGATRLSAAGSLFSGAYAWSIVSGPDGTTPATGATLADANTAQPTFNVTRDGTYVLSLVTSSGSAQSTPKRLTLVVDSALAPAPSAIRFADIKAAMQTDSACTVCHSASGIGLRPPVYFTDDDRNGDGAVGDATDDAWFHAEVRSRVNFADIAASPLLQKPAGINHAGSRLAGFDASAAPGQPARAKYDLFLNWILNGAPQ
jgi:mono/diheme cytochrome c family protein